MLIFIRPENGNLPSSSCGYLFAAVFWDAIPTLRHGFAWLAWFSHNVRVNMLRINESHTLCLPVANRRMCASSASFQRTNLFRILGSFTTWVTFPIYPAFICRWKMYNTVFNKVVPVRPPSLPSPAESSVIAFVISSVVFLMGKSFLPSAIPFAILPKSPRFSFRIRH